MSARPKALVTGASSGIGAVYADRLVRLGHDVVLVARDEARLRALAERLQGEHGDARIEVLRADLLDRADLARVEARLRDDDAIALLVNNAGISAAGSFIDADPDKLETIITLNATVVTRLALAAAKRFVARGSGTIVNIGSVTALMPESFEPVYLATKAYVLALSQSLQQQLEPRGVRVQAVLPGMTRTEIWERSGVDPQALPPDMLMEASELVDAALAGLDMGETVTIPSLPDAEAWDEFNAQRRRLGPFLSRRHAAERYRLAIE
ncbi:SDR family NAD(P)-dependent oxidoreductase [Lysobacter solisilvae (ex Woo and Kim 2020)]|uniref:SDR family oxidoreductase n=1 Tax=Agrilutibacter terrestris TaxID=2865112 RepID=A0A7H0FU14_9GAMM|nr:SDR family oxidoreductase [Lysobacter terrestris]QNP39530.1 SDR family oxidoreductase [Lysobacter terrestris]